MKKRTLGTICVSPIGMGCMGFSHGYGQIPDRAYSIQAIRKAHDFGCTFFDTAESYGRELYYPGHNEEIVGEAVEPFRNDIVLATKFHIAENTEKSESLYTLIRSHLESSMKRLRTDYIDLYYLHRINDNYPIEEIAPVMGTLIKEGLIRGWGLSQVPVSTLSAAHSITPVSAVQNLYSMVERDCEKEIFPFCLSHNIGVVPFSPVASGFLSGKVTPETKFEGDDVRKFVPQLSKENPRCYFCLCKGKAGNKCANFSCLDAEEVSECRSDSGIKKPGTDSGKSRCLECNPLRCGFSETGAGTFRLSDLRPPRSR